MTPYEQIDQLKERIADLSNKLDEAIDLLDVNERAYLLNEWAKRLPPKPAQAEQE